MARAAEKSSFGGGTQGKLSIHSAGRRPRSQLRFTSDGKRLVAGSGHLTQRKGELIIWDVEREQIVRIRAGGNQRARHIHDDRVIATCGTSGQIHLWDCDSAEYIRVMGQPGEAYYSVAFSDDGKLLAAGGDSSVAIFDVESGSVVEEVRSFRSRRMCPSPARTV